MILDSLLPPSLWLKSKLVATFFAAFGQLIATMRSREPRRLARVSVGAR